VRILLIHGDERFLVDREVDRWRSRAAPGQLDVEVFEAPARLDALRHSVMEVPLLDPERTILVRDPPQLTGAGRRGADPPEALAALLAMTAPTTSLCLVAHMRVAAQNPVLPVVRKLGGSVVFHPAPKARELRAWLEGAVRERGLRLPQDGIERLLRTVGADLGALSTELDKLSALGAGRPLTRADVDHLVAGDEPMELWGVLEQLMGPDPGRGAATLAGLLDEGRSTQHLLGILAGQARDLLLAQAILRTRRSAASIAAELRIPEWRAERLARQARNVPPALVAGWIRDLHEADRRSKAGEVGDAEALRIFAVHAAQSVVSSRALRTPDPG
jgi:DNA polymerase III delta subunit